MRTLKLVLERPASWSRSANQKPSDGQEKNLRRPRLIGKTHAASRR